MSTKTTTQTKKVFYTPFSLRNEANKLRYKAIGKELIDRFGIKDLRERWNRSGLGRPATETTINRWLSPGPFEKNANFEGFMISLHENCEAKKKAPTLAQHMATLKAHVKAGRIAKGRDSATAASLIAYYGVDTYLSSKQRELVLELNSRASV